MNLYTLRRPSERRLAIRSTPQDRRRSPGLGESDSGLTHKRRSQDPAWLHGLGLLAALLVLAAIACGFLLVFAEIARRVGELGRPGVPAEARADPY